MALIQISELFQFTQIHHNPRIVKSYSEPGHQTIHKDGGWTSIESDKVFLVSQGSDFLDTLW